MKSNLIFAKICLILYSVKTIESKEPKGQTFCFDNSSTESIFMIGNNSYLMKASNNLYISEVGQTFNGEKPEEPKNVFRIDLLIKTGFYVSAIPDCVNSTVNCSDLARLNKLGFIIGKNISSYIQLYQAFRINNSQIEPITQQNEDKEMPFNMKRSDIIRKGDFWTHNSTTSENIQVIAATYDERDFSFVYISWSRSDPLLLTIRLLTDFSQIYTFDISKLISTTSRQPLVLCRGFVNIFENKNESRKTLALFMDKKTNELLVEYLPGATKREELEEHLREQVLCYLSFGGEDNLHFYSLKNEIDLNRDIYGCSVTPPPPTTSVRTTVQTSESSTETDITENNNENTPSIVELSSKPNDDNPGDNWDEKTILFIVFIVVVIMTVILFVAMISTFHYIRFVEKKIKRGK